MPPVLGGAGGTAWWYLGGDWHLPELPSHPRAPPRGKSVAQPMWLKGLKQPARLGLTEKLMTVGTETKLSL